MRKVAGTWLARLKGRERSDFLYIVWLCWGAALLLYVLGSPCFLWPVAPMPLVLLVWLMERVGMFGKKRDGAASVSAGATVIAAGARFKGELQVEGDLEVRGHVNGTIQLTGGVLRITQGGTVEGDVSAPHVIINGLLEGTCTSAEVEILESGKMQGIFKGGSLSICKGGNFVGQSQPTVAGKADPVLQALSENRSSENKQPENKNNVKKLLHEPKGKVTEELAKQA
ncbi:polymer-forming cytoskeletal protein [Aeromonas allosaccharophila]|uniref:bactofilin family protein n=1 Tax=Aeromonas allosaccharophila TaxID=656 RepID=UPI0038D12438